MRQHPISAAVMLTGLLAACAQDGVAPATVRYFVAAEPVDWDYAPLGRDPAFDRPLPEPWGRRHVYPKLRYIQYTDATFSVRVEGPPSAGILGPVLRVVVGDTLEVVFLNRTDGPVSMHPHGVRYGRGSEGAAYEPGGMSRGIAPPGGRVTYTWAADEGAGPTPREPSSKVWLYHSHVAHDHEIQRGLVGTIVVTDPRRANPDRTPRDVDRELTAFFMVWDENRDESAHEAGHEAGHDAPEAEHEANLKHAINGRFFANLEGLEMKVGERVRWYLVALGNEADLHTAHWHAETVATELGSRTDVVELLPASMRVVDMFPRNPGTWLFHCHVSDHMMAGMFTRYVIR